MQAAVYYGRENLQVQNWPEPRLAAGEALVRVRYAGICGTDMTIYSGKHRTIPPCVLGHEIFGSIAEIGPAVEPCWKLGARVAVFPLISCKQCTPCREGNAHVCEKLAVVGVDLDGGFAGYVKVAPDQLVEVPQNVDDDQAALIEPLSVAVHSVRNSRFRPGDTVLITGGGPIGNLLAQVLRASGARMVVVSEVKEFRRALAERLGFQTFDPSREDAKLALKRILGEPVVDQVFEATGFPAAYKDAVQCSKVRGEITFVGIPKTPPEVDIQTIVFKEIRASSSRVYTLHDYLGAIALLARRAVDVGPVITDRLPLKDAVLAFQKMFQAEASLKILLAP